MIDYLIAFVNWFHTHEEELIQDGFSFTLHGPSGSDKPACFTDIDSSRYMARVIIWETSECELKALDLQSSEHKSDLPEKFYLDWSKKFDSLFRNGYDLTEFYC